MYKMSGHQRTQFVQNKVNKTKVWKYEHDKNSL